MKPLLPILLSLLISATLVPIPSGAFCQSAVDSFFNIKTQKPPENWVELIQGKDWDYEYFVEMKGNRVKRVIADDVAGLLVKFDSSKIIFPSIFDGQDPLSTAPI